jgi:hypothetical protein
LVVVVVVADFVRNVAIRHIELIIALYYTHRNKERLKERERDIKCENKVKLKAKER